MRQRRILSVAATAMALTMALTVLSACGSDSQADDAGAGATTGSSPSPSASPSDDGGGRYGYGTSGGGGGDAGSDKADVKVAVSNYEFTPSTVHVSHGDVLGLTNTEMTTTHTFTVDGEDIDVTLPADASTSVTIDLPPGSYPFECRFHASQGMKGTLVVG
jgi:plastocyanin